MFYIIHGTDTTASKNRVYELSQGKNPITINAEKGDIKEIRNVFSSIDMFAQDKLIVIEKPLKISKSDLETIMDNILESVKGDLTVIFWHNTELSKAFLGKFKGAKIESFMLPKLFFSFLDLLTPQNLKEEIEILGEMENLEAEQIFYAMVKRVRLLILIKKGSRSSEILETNPWVLGKLQEQSRMWDLSRLESMQKRMFELEIKMKSGGLVLPLKKQLDIVLTHGLN